MSAPDTKVDAHARAKDPSRSTCLGASLPPPLRSGLWQWTDVLRSLESELQLQRNVATVTKTHTGQWDARAELFYSTAMSNATSHNNKSNLICIDAVIEIPEFDHQYLTICFTSPDLSVCAD